MKSKNLVNYFIKILFTTILVFSLLLSTTGFKFYSRNTNAQEKISSSTQTVSLENDDNLYLTNEYATNYFYNLTENFGVNVMGSCGYVALGMLLGYYDTYWNDNFIPEALEQKAVLSTNNFTTNTSSPGGKREPNVLGQTYTDVQDYIQRVVNNNYSDYLHLNLIKLGLDEEFYGIGGPSLDDDLGLSNDINIKELTEKYLYEERAFSSNNVGIEWTCVSSLSKVAAESTQIRQFVEERVKQGIPVLISAAKLAPDGSTILGRHAMIAYDYKYENYTNILYVHTGQTDGSSSVITHITLEDFGYNALTSAIALVPKTNHSHTANYQYGTTTYCPCTTETYYKGTISFDNLDCLVNNARVTYNDMYIQNADAFEFDCRTTYSLANLEAYVQNYGYDPCHFFLGWYTDLTFANKVETISAGTKGVVKLYAKWRVDYKTRTRIGEHLITSAGPMNNYSDEIVVATVDDLQKMQQMGITKMTIKLYINMWEVVNGTQYVYLYGGSNGTNLLASKEITDTTGSPTVKEVIFTVNITDLQETPYVYIRYNASEFKFIIIISHDWKNDQIHAEISFVTAESDITGAGMPGFYF